MDKIKHNFVILSEKIQTEPSASNIKDMTNLLRDLRALCASSVDVRKTVFDQIDLTLLIQLFQSMMTLNQSDDSILCVKIGLQVIGNTVVQNDIQCVEQIWNSANHFLLDCFKHKDEKLNIIVMMILFNIFKYLPNIAFHTLLHNIVLEQAIAGNEFAIYFLEDILYSNESQTENEQLSQIFDSLNCDHQLYVMEYLKVTVKPGVDLNHFVRMFNRDACQILLSDSVDVSHVQTTVLCLELLTEYSASNNYRKTLQDNLTFVSNVFEFLKSMHLQGKENSEHRFAPDQNLSNMFSSSQDDNPVFGLKATCVKLVANLCWSHSVNQNLARTSQCFPVLLECCNLDAKNPLIKEWAVFAIRNCCENNSENQLLIAQLNRTNDHVIDTSSTVNLAPGVNIGTLKKT